MTKVFSSRGTADHSRRPSSAWRDLSHLARKTGFPERRALAIDDVLVTLGLAMEAILGVADQNPLLALR